MTAESFVSQSDRADADLVTPASALGFHNHMLDGGNGSASVGVVADLVTPASALGSHMFDGGSGSASVGVDPLLPTRRVNMLHHSSFSPGLNGRVGDDVDYDGDDEESSESASLVRVLERGDPPMNGHVGEEDLAALQAIVEGPRPAVTSWRAVTRREDIEAHLQFLLRVGISLTVLRRISLIDEVSILGEEGRHVRFFDGEGIMILTLRVYAPGEGE